MMNARQTTAALDFINTAKANRMTCVAAAFRRNHPMILANKVRQIRKVKDAIAECYDELGNRVVLTTDLRIVQLIGGR